MKLFQVLRQDRYVVDEEGVRWATYRSDILYRIVSRWYGGYWRVIAIDRHSGSDILKKDFVTVTSSLFFARFEAKKLLRNSIYQRTKADNPSPNSWP